jgi:ribonuclease PH
VLLQKVLAHAIIVMQYPRTCIQVVVQVCREGGSEFAVMMNAAVAAVLDAGISMHSMLACATVAVTKKGELLVDPDTREQSVRSGSIGAVFEWSAWF